MLIRSVVNKKDNIHCLDQTQRSNIQE